MSGLNVKDVGMTERRVQHADKGKVEGMKNMVQYFCWPKALAKHRNKKLFHVEM